MNKDIEKAIFAAGCFWGVEYVFKKFPGITKIKSGYTGGSIKDPTYEEVCTGKTGHAEAIYLEFDKNKITYNKLLDIFFQCHDPTTINKQGPDIGNQYRSAVFYFTNDQKNNAFKAKEIYEKKIGKKVVTTIEKAQEFFDAESYHQNYYSKSSSKPYCHIVPDISI